MAIKALDHKHERLVRQTYPPGSNVEKRPKPSELSYLMYYVTTHRAKIPKVAEYLEHNAARYFTKNKIGNGMVTLEIVYSLVDKCRDDLNVFGPQVVNILSMAFTTGDLLIVEEAGRVFEVFNKYFNGLSFAANNQFSNEYVSLVRQFGELAVATGSQARQFRAVATRALAALPESPVLQTSTGARALQIAIKALYLNIPVDEDGLVFTQFSSQLDTVDHDFQSPGASEGNSALFALAGLRNTFDTASAGQVSRATESLVNGLSPEHPYNWIVRLFEFVAQWSQVQLRFIIPNAIVKYIEAKVAVTDLLSQDVLCQIINGLFSSSVSMVGLSVVDYLRRLLDLQHRLLTHDWSPAQEKDVKRVTLSYRQCITTLARHTIYPGQTSDMMAETLVKYAVLPDSKPSASDSVIVADLENVLAILNAIPAGEKIPLTSWLSTQWILTRNDPLVVKTYTRAFTSFLLRSHPLPLPFSRNGSAISRQLCQSLTEPTNSSINYISTYYCLVGLVDHLGSDATSIVPWVLQVQDAGLRVESAASSRNAGTELTALQGNSLVSVAQATLLAVTRTTERAGAASKVFNAVQTRVSRAQWLPGIIYPASVRIDEAIDTAVAHPPSSVGAVVPPEEQIAIKSSDLDLTDEERSWAADPHIALDEPVTSEDLQVFKTRARSLTDSMTTGGEQRMLSSRTFSNIDVDAPKVTDLRKRVSGRFAAPVLSNASSRPPAGKLADLLAKIDINHETARGRLVV